jgi:hypothetical protein
MSNPTANHFELLSALQINYAKGKVDVTDSFSSMSVTEDLFKNSVACTLDLVDSTDSLGVVDFDGTETFTLSFKGLKDSDRIINLTFRAYKVDIQVSPEKTDMKIYRLHGVTPEHIKQSTMDINQSFKMPVSKAVENVFSKIGTKRPLEVDDTAGSYTYIVPGMTPFESFEFLQRRAYDSRYRASMFLFYETVDGYKFKNVEKLIEEQRDDAPVFRYQPVANLKTEDDDPTKNIEHLEISANKNILKKIKSGAYANAVREIDLVNQRVNSTEVRVKEDFKTFVHLDKAAMSLDSKAIIDESLNIINSTKWINKVSDQDDKRGQLIPRRRFYFDCLSQVETRVVVPGNSNLSVGNVIDIDMLELAGKTNNKTQEPKVSGKYLVTQVKHILGRGSYRTNLLLNKESYNANVEDLSKNLVVVK